MTAALAATDCGWNALYYGPNLPAAETAAAALHERARAVALSISCPAYDGLLERELGVLRQSLGDGVPIFIGGRSGCAYQEAIAAAGGRSFRSIREFKNFLLQTETA
jgi:methylmalonyl-CoA mutase cobalamin-binding subunit